MATYTGTYVDSSSFVDNDLRAIAENNTTFISRSETWFTDYCGRLNVTPPLKADLTENQKRVIELWCYRMICQANTGRNYNETQDGFIDKYQQKNVMYSAELFGNNGVASSSNTIPQTKSLAQTGLLDVVQEELTRSLESLQPILEYNW